MLWVGDKVKFVSLVKKEAPGIYTVVNVDYYVHPLQIELEEFPGNHFGRGHLEQVQEDENDQIICRRCL